MKKITPQLGWVCNLPEVGTVRLAYSEELTLIERISELDKKRKALLSDLREKRVETLKFVGKDWTAGEIADAIAATKPTE
jgi:hypothetical protein